MTIDDAINILFPATSRLALNNYQEGKERLEACNQACVYGAMALKVLRSYEDDMELSGRLREIAWELTKEITEAGHADEC
nr:MAG TPA: hypothetical protein [Caudoviricetes sp.]